MVKKIVLLFLLVTAALGADAQLRYGIRLGGEFSRPTGYAHATGGNGFAGGLEVEYLIPTTGLGFDMAAEYSRRHFGMPGMQSRGYDFISVPIDIRYHLPLGFTRDLVTVFPFTGADFAWQLNKGAERRFHPGWRVGLGVSVINFVNISGGYRLGLRDIAPSLRDSGAFLAVSILFNI